MDYFLNQQGEFVIEDYDLKKSFTSFLPGVAGKMGIPIWAFYVNRGQGMASFGIENKNSPILEFFPANSAYQYIDRYGFRTFLKWDDAQIYEPFAPRNANAVTSVKRTMKIRKSDFTVIEHNEDLGFHLEITYFGLPEMNMGALVRKVTLTNLKPERTVKILDGIATLLPSGVTTNAYKEMGNLMRSWMEVSNLEEHIPFFKVRASTSDQAEVSTFEKGHFYGSFTENHQWIEPIIDPRTLFGFNTALTFPDQFDSIPFGEKLEQQVTVNQVPCSFTPIKVSLVQNEKMVLHTLIGHVDDLSLMRLNKEKIGSHEFLDQKYEEGFGLIESIVSDIETKTAYPLFDAYVKHCYLDNMLRGGYPIRLKGEDKAFIYYIYSRKHGDPEREYNFFVLSPEYYSNGEGNFRDINQNRRSDVYFTKEAGIYNIKLFMDLIQLDGYNPLIVQGSEFKIETPEHIDMLLSKHIQGESKPLVALLNQLFTPGKVIKTIEMNRVQFKTSLDALLTEIYQMSSQTNEARHGEGFWSDHFTYNLDLIESYLQIYPDQLQELLFDHPNYRFFESIESVLPRHEKYCINSKGDIRQYGSVIKDHHKIKQLNLNEKGTNWAKTLQGEIIETTLCVKLLSLAVNKFALLDPMGLGIEMEANKPGWNDAMNGLPGLIGSGMGETYELLRIISFLEESIRLTQEVSVRLPEEIHDFYLECVEIIGNNKGLYFQRWNALAQLRETYRSKIRFGISGIYKEISSKSLINGLVEMKVSLEESNQRALAMKEGLMPTFYVYEAENYKVIENAGVPVKTPYGLPAVEIHSFKMKCLPAFLEAPARYLKTEKNVLAARALFEKVRASDIYDEKLQMYKTSGSLEQESFEIGRIKAFTPGWLERESVFLHMTYKYIWGLLYAGLYDAYYEAIETNMVPFMNPEIYGRNVLENSSFIASSVNPDKSTHGQGFVSRLSGSNSEVISIWYYMMVGPVGFQYDQQLTFTLSPILRSDFFDNDNQVAFKLLKDTKVTYVNPNRKSTFGSDKAEIKRMELQFEGKTIQIEGNQLKATEAHQLRDGQIQAIIAYLD